MLDKLRRLGDRAIAIAATLVTLALLAIVCAEAVLRNLDRSLTWSQELAQYLLVWLGFLGWIIASRRRSHIRITVLLDRMPKLLRTATEVVIQLGIIALALLLVWQGRALILRNLDVPSVSLPFPQALLYMLLPLLGLALVLQAAGEIVAALRGRTAAPSAREGQTT